MKNIEFKLNIINKILNPIVTIISNIKYLFCSDLKTRLDSHSIRIHSNGSKLSRIFSNIDIDNIEDKMYDMDNSINDIQNDLEDKASEYEIRDILHDTFGYSEDYVNYDDMNDIKEEIKDIKNHLKTDIDNINLDLFYDKYHSEIVLKVIEEIIFKLGNNSDNV